MADATDAAPGEAPYRPTHVVRILEFDTNNLNVNNRMSKADVELWDVSGNHGFEQSWPALARDAHGAVFVFDPRSDQQARELEIFHAHFAEKAGLTDSQCIVLASIRAGEPGNARGGKLCKNFI